MFYMDRMCTTEKTLPFEVCLISPFWFFRKFCQKNLFFFFQSAFPKRKVEWEDEGKGKNNFRKKHWLVNSRDTFKHYIPFLYEKQE